MATTPSNGKLIYHMTSIDNLPSILKFGLLPRKYLLQNHNVQFTDVADPEILSKRERYKKALSQYVLFHIFYTPRNQMDFVQKNGIKKPFHNMFYSIFLHEIHLIARCVKNMDRKTW